MQVSDAGYATPVNILTISFFGPFSLVRRVSRIEPAPAWLITSSASRIYSENVFEKVNITSSKGFTSVTSNAATASRKGLVSTVLFPI